MRISLFLTIAVCAVSLCMADIASAQRGGGGLGGRGTTNSWLGLLRMETVQDEIELVPDQMEEIEGLQEEMWGEMQERMADLRELEPADRREQFANLRTEMEERQGEYQTKIEGVLLPMQLKRLKELHIQSTARRRGNDGAGATLQNEDLLEELGVDEEQKKKLEEKAKELREEMQEKIKKLQKKAEEELLSVLTPEQREMYREKVGETFDFGNDRDRGFQRGGAGRGGRGGRGGARGERGGREARPGRDS